MKKPSAPPASTWRTSHERGEMTDEIDEWAFEMRREIEKAMEAGQGIITFTVPVKSLTTVVDIVHSHFRETSRTCYLCGAIRRLNEFSVRVEDWRRTQGEPDWRRDARKPKR